MTFQWRSDELVSHKALSKALWQPLESFTQWKSMEIHGNPMNLTGFDVQLRNEADLVTIFEHAQDFAQRHAVPASPSKLSWALDMMNTQ